MLHAFLCVSPFGWRVFEKKSERKESRCACLCWAGALACVGPESQSDRMDVGLFLILALASLVWSWSGVWSGTRRVVGEEIEVSFSFLGQGEVVT